MADWQIDTSKYKDLLDGIDDQQLSMLESKAHRQVDLLTHGFYDEKSDFDGDMNSLYPLLKKRAKAYLEAVVDTMLLMKETGATSTSELLSKGVTSVKIGDTTVNAGDISKATSGGVDGYFVPASAVNSLSMHGLLYAGLG